MVCVCVWVEASSLPGKVLYLKEIIRGKEEENGVHRKRALPFYL